jgi:hypothetical protein
MGARITGFHMVSRAAQITDIRTVSSIMHVPRTSAWSQAAVRTTDINTALCRSMATEATMVMALCGSTGQGHLPDFGANTGLRWQHRPFSPTWLPAAARPTDTKMDSCSSTDYSHSPGLHGPQISPCCQYRPAGTTSVLAACWLRWPSIEIHHSLGHTALFCHLGFQFSESTFEKHPSIKTCFYFS